MPFKSQQQRRFFYATMPKKAKEWEKETPKGKLPKKVKKECGPDPVAMERIPGGEGEQFDPADFDQVQLMKGIHHELEHGGDVVTAMEIAMDHLAEDPMYYDASDEDDVVEPDEQEDEESCAEIPQLEDVYCCVDPRHGEDDVPDPEDAGDAVKHAMPFAQSSIRTGR